MKLKNSMVVAAIAATGMLAGCGGDGSQGAFGALTQNAGHAGPNNPNTPTPDIELVGSACQTNVQHFASKQDVYISSNLPTRAYWVRVSAPGGGNLGVSTTASLVVPIAGGCTRLWDLVEQAPSVAGFLDTTNGGGVYNVDVCEDANFRTGCKQKNFDIQSAPPATVHLDVTKFYDADENGLLEQADADAAALGNVPVEIAGWHFEVLDANDVVVASGVTPAGAALGFDLAPGVYTVREVMPNETNWFATTAETQTADLTAGAQHLWFGNACELSPGGHTRGFWQSPNGHALWDADDFSDMTALNLRDAIGTVFDPQEANGDLGWLSFYNWIRNANASVMVHQLSAQLAACQLSVNHGFSDASIYAGQLPDGTWVTVADLIDHADGLLAAWTSVASAQTRADEDWAKTRLDEVNNGMAFTQPSYAGCPATWTEPTEPVVIQ